MKQKKLKVKGRLRLLATSQDEEALLKKNKNPTAKFQKSPKPILSFFAFAFFRRRVVLRGERERHFQEQLPLWDSYPGNFPYTPLRDSEVVVCYHYVLVVVKTLGKNDLGLSLSVNKAYCLVD